MEESYSVNSSEREERIKARRARIENRINSRDEEGLKNKRDAPERKQLSRGRQQIADSLVNLDKKKSSTIEHVTSIRVNTDGAENARRIEEEDKRQDRLRSLQDEAVASGKQNAAIEMKWAELMEHNMPQELMREMTIQQTSCQRIINSKNSLIQSFQTELKRKDEEYVKSLKQQNEDIEELLKRMGNQYKLLQEEYASELEAIEGAFLKEREELLENNRTEIDSLFEKRRSMEMHFMEARQDREEKYQRELDELRARDAEDYNKLKIKLETDIQTLEQQLEEMRATYQLNTEKLEYNYRVLTERDMENSATLAQQKRKLTRLKDGLSSLMSRYHSTDQKYKIQNMELTEEYRRITKQYKDLQSKFKHFEVADNKRYEEVWRMHEQEIRHLARTLQDADKVIHNQQLGLSWKRRHIPKIEFGAHATKLINEESRTDADDTQGNEEKIKDMEDSTSESGEKEKDNADAQHVMVDSIASEKTKLLLNILADEAGFLIEEKVKASIQNAEGPTADMLRADAILRALNIETKAELDDLATLFFEAKRADEMEELEFAIERAESDEEKLQLLGLKVKLNDVVRIITGYMEGRSSNASKERAIDRMKQQDLDLKTSQDIRRENDRREEKRFWDEMVNVVPESTNRVWNALEGALQKYNNVLKDRAALVDDVSMLQQKNDELRNLLNQYLNADIEKELVVPPSHTIVVKDLNNLYR